MTFASSFSRLSERARTRAAWIGAGVVVALGVAVACGPSGFTSDSVVSSVRVLATRVDNDKAYAHPGDMVTLETLTVDGRPNPTPPAVLYWVPFVCENPASDLFYNCFASLIAEDGGAGDAAAITFGGGGTGAGTGASDDAGSPDGGATPSPVLTPGELPQFFRGGVDVTDLLPTGPYTLTVPANAVTSHPPVTGAAPYGLLFVFNIACAGRVKTVPLDPNGGPEQVPIGCFDSSGNALDADNYVIGYTRVYVSQDKTDLNPRIAGFLFNGTEIDAGGLGDGLPSAITLPPVPACGSNCNGIPIDMDVPGVNWDGGKSIWVDYFAKGGSLSDDAKLLYDTTAGRLSDVGHEVKYSPPATPGPATLWAVVHDSNDGVSWLQVNVTAK
jgi:hypothetical protein